MHKFRPSQTVGSMKAKNYGQDKNLGSWYNELGPATTTIHNLASLFLLVCIASSFILYIGPLEGLIGHREVVRELHVVSGLLAMLVLVVGFSNVWGRAMSKVWNLAMTWSSTDDEWIRRWRTSLRRPYYEESGLNPGQKVAFAVVVALLAVLVVSGLILRLFAYFPLWLRVGATLSHTLFAYALVALVLTHLYFVAQKSFRR